MNIYVIYITTTRSFWNNKNDKIDKKKTTTNVIGIDIECKHIKRKIKKKDSKWERERERDIISYII